MDLHSRIHRPHLYPQRIRAGGIWHRRVFVARTFQARVAVRVTMALLF
jgi:hypothetical protein